jgi:hypothetical protein
MTHLILLTLPAVLVGLMIPVLLADHRVNPRSRERQQAEERGAALLRSWLTPEQARQWVAHRYGVPS